MVTMACGFRVVLLRMPFCRSRCLAHACAVSGATPFHLRQPWLWRYGSGTKKRRGVGGKGAMTEGPRDKPPTPPPAPLPTCLPLDATATALPSKNKVTAVQRQAGRTKNQRNYAPEDPIFLRTPQNFTWPHFRAAVGKFPSYHHSRDA
jgi:hypothetical protein